MTTSPDMSVGSDADVAAAFKLWQEIAERPVVKRKLASIQTIDALDPIEGADAIECATILGWTVVVKKGEFAVGDQAVFFEIDSYLPMEPEYEFLRKSSYRIHPDLGEGYRLKTCKLRGCLSQGLALPRNVLFPYHGVAHDVGTDVTELLGVRKYEIPENGGGGPGVIRGDCEGRFPEFIRKTDQERVQNIHRWIMSHWLGMEFETTLKVDGTSLTAFHHQPSDGDLKTGVCSRNWNLKEDSENRQSQYWEIVKKIGLLDAMREVKRNIAVQGELMGPGIQKNREQFKDRKLFIFDIWDIDLQRYLTPSERSELIGELVTWFDPAGGDAWDHVPKIETVVLDETWTLQKFLDYADRPSINHPIGEGVVFKSTKPNGPSFKIVSNKFLLKEKD